jgi:hypothetical protein|nr:MAG TPA: hypothetical protein [Caudoviricetes sp.]
MAKEKYIVTVGPRAYSFHDQSTGITVCKGEDKELSRRQYRTQKIQKAIAAGHLIIVADKSDIEKYSESDIEKLDKRLNAQFKKGMTLEKLSKGYSLEELKLVANLHEIVAEKNDTVETLLQALLEEFESSSKG